MKKKGLIISTIVMVVVLIASLTTATYAWFSTSSVTKLEDFTVSVTANNAVNIGVKANGTVVSGDSINASMFRTGTVTYVKGTEGKIGGNWGTSGSSGLSANLDPQIKWGAQSNAVGALKNTTGGSGEEAYDYTDATKAANYTTITDALTNFSGDYLLKAAHFNDAETALVATSAKPNFGATASDNGDYAYLVLGVQPNGSANLPINTLCIALDWTGQEGATLGVIASLHVAYRVTKAASATASAVSDAWTEVDIMSFDKTSETAYHATTNATNASGINYVASNIVDGESNGDPMYATAYEQTYGTAPGSDTTYMVPITGLSTTIGYIDQIELIIYMDGTDGDCVTSGTTNINCKVRIFFCNKVKTTA